LIDRAFSWLCFSFHQKYGHLPTRESSRSARSFDVLADVALQHPGRHGSAGQRYEKTSVIEIPSKAPRKCEH
jgi:hypothetical protein